MNNMDEKDLAFIDKFPQIKLRNKFFSNNGKLRFTDRRNSIANDKPTYSNGAVYADFDNDGDLDIVVNNIDEEAYLYRNNTDTGTSVKIILEGAAANRNALGQSSLFSAERKSGYLKNTLSGDFNPVWKFRSWREPEGYTGFNDHRMAG